MSHKDRNSILMVVGDLPPRPSGIGDFAARVMHFMAAEGVGVTAVTSAVAGAPEREAHDGVTIVRCMRDWTFREVSRIFAVLDTLGTKTAVNVQYAGPGYGRRLMINALPAIVRLRRPAAFSRP